MKKLLILALPLLLLACGGGSKEATPTKAVDMMGRIAHMEDSLFNSGEHDVRSAQALLDVYKAYVAAFPVDSMAPEYLFRAAGVAKSMRDPRQSIALYNRIIADYPGWKRLADAFYLKAFTMDSDLDQKGEAKRAYEEVIDLFPDHAFARDARIMIENLQYTDEELIMKFKKMEEEREQAKQ